MEAKGDCLPDKARQAIRALLAAFSERLQAGRRMFDRSFAEFEGEDRRAVNFLLQGQVADLIKQAQVRLYRELLQRKMRATDCLAVTRCSVCERPRR